MSEAGKKYVLDTSAMLALMSDEQGADVVGDIIGEAKKHQAVVYISFVTLTEIYYTALRRKDEEGARKTMALINELPLQRVYSNDTLSLSAGYIKANHKLSLADAFIAATALDKEAVLVHKDPEFEAIISLVETIKLPLKQRSR